ncbi:MAG: Ca-activated chloride channel family protein [Kiritimatiellia bacterium]|jgi:Ca-activated chloride channel family protein
MSRALLSLCLLGSMGCAEYGMRGGVGVTAGGSQDMGLARALIEDGQVPARHQFAAEGLFSEHDLPLDGDVCTELLCPRAAATVHRPLDGGDDKVLVQLGFGTSITADSFARPDLDLALLVDVSCSMSDGKLKISKDGVQRLLQELDEDDFVSLVEFGSRAKLRQARVRMDEAGRQKMENAVQRLSIGGSTDMESGMRKAYEQLDDDPELSARLLVFTDAQPNTGVTDDSAFVSLVRGQADEGVGTTLLGTGTDLGSGLANALGKVRGGNYYYVDEDSVERVFTDEFDFMVTPLAYDMEATLVSLEGVSLGDDVYGAPIDGDAVKLGASTLFPSSRNGGMAATFDIVPDGPVGLGTLRVVYVPVGATEPVSQSLAVGWEGGVYRDEADDLGVYKIAVLVDEYKAMLAAAEVMEGLRTAEEAIVIVSATEERLQAMATDLDDEQLAQEALLMQLLADNL